MTMRQIADRFTSKTKTSHITLKSVNPGTK